MMAFTRMARYNTGNFISDDPAALEAPQVVRHSEVTPCLTAILPHQRFIITCLTMLAANESQAVSILSPKTNSTVLSTSFIVRLTSIKSAKLLTSQSALALFSLALHTPCRLFTLFLAMILRVPSGHCIASLTNAIYAVNGLNFRLLNSITSNVLSNGEAGDLEQNRLFPIKRIIWNKQKDVVGSTLPSVLFALKISQHFFVNLNTFGQFNILFYGFEVQR